MARYDDDEEDEILDDPVGEAIQEGEVGRIQRSSRQEAEMFGGRAPAFIDVSRPDPVGAATRQNAAGRINRTNEQENQMFGFESQQQYDSPEDRLSAQIDSRRSALVQSLSSNRDPDYPASRPDARRRLQMSDELKTLNHFKLQSTAIATRQAEEDYKQNEHIRVMSDTQKLLRELGSVTANYGSEDRFNAIISLRNKYPGAMESVAGRQELERQARLHDEEMKFRRGLKVADSDRAQDQQNKKDIINYRQSVAEPKVVNVGETDLANLGITPEQFQKRGNIRATDSALETQNPSTPDELTDVETQRKDQGKKIAFDVGGQTFLASREVFNRLNRTFPQSSETTKPASSNQPTQAPSGPAVGDRRTINGEEAEWDGKGWRRVK